MSRSGEGGPIDAAALDAHRAWLAQGGTGDTGRLVLSGVDATGRNFSRQDLSQCVATEATFDRVVFDGCKLRALRAIASSFREAVFGDATLDDAVFQDCDLRDADLSSLGARNGTGTTAGCRFERCDLRGTIWLERDVSRAVFIDCRFDFTAGWPRSVDSVEIVRPALGPTGAREVSATDIFKLWGVGANRAQLSDDDKAYIRKSFQGRWRKADAYARRGTRPMSADTGSLADKWKDPPQFLPIGTATGQQGVLASTEAMARSLAPTGTMPEAAAHVPDTDDDAGDSDEATQILTTPPARRAAAEPPPRMATAAEPGARAPGSGRMATGAEHAATSARLATGAEHTGSGARMATGSEYTGSSARMATGADAGSSAPAMPRMPPSPWWEPGLPLRLAASRPFVPQIAAAAAVSDKLMALAGLQPAAQPLDDATRNEVTRRLGNAGVGDARRIVETLATVHDLRGLATALAEGTPTHAGSGGARVTSTVAAQATSRPPLTIAMSPAPPAASPGPTPAVSPIGTSPIPPMGTSPIPPLGTSAVPTMMMQPASMPSLSMQPVPMTPGPIQPAAGQPLSMQPAPTAFAESPAVSYGPPIPLFPATKSAQAGAPALPPRPATMPASTRPPLPTMRLELTDALAVTALPPEPAPAPPTRKTPPPIPAVAATRKTPPPIPAVAATRKTPPPMPAATLPAPPQRPSSTSLPSSSAASTPVPMPSMPPYGGPSPYEHGAPIALPSSVAVRRAPNGVCIYQDSRSGFEVALPSPTFLEASPQMDATVGLATTVLLDIVHLPGTPQVAPADEVATLVRDITSRPAQLFQGGTGVTAAAMATGLGALVRHVAALAAPAAHDGTPGAIVLLLLAYDPAEIDDATVLTAWTAIVGSVRFGAPYDRVPDLVPASAWWEPGFPLKLAASRPVLPAVQDGGELAAWLLRHTEQWQPTRRFNLELIRETIARRLAGSGIPDAVRVAESVSTIHCLRGLAVALAGIDCLRPGLVAEGTLAPSLWSAPRMDFLPSAMPRAHSVAANERFRAARVVAITPAEAAAHGLPAVGLRADFGGTRMTETALRWPGSYLSSSGAPGAALGFHVRASDERGTDHTAVRRAVAAQHVGPELTWGATGTVTIAGAVRPAVMFVSDRFLVTTHNCALLIPHAHGALLVTLVRSYGHGTPVSCDDIAGDPELAPVIASFAIIEGH